jgi:hypothetical protein
MVLTSARGADLCYHLGKGQPDALIRPDCRLNACLRACARIASWFDAAPARTYNSQKISEQPSI